MTGSTIRIKRRAAGIPLFAVSKKSGVSTTKLSSFERDIAKASAAELERILTALDELTAARERIRQTAVEVGWPAEVSL